MWNCFSASANDGESRSLLRVNGWLIVHHGANNAVNYWWWLTMVATGWYWFVNLAHGFAMMLYAEPRRPDVVNQGSVKPWNQLGKCDQRWYSITCHYQGLSITIHHHPRRHHTIFPNSTSSSCSMTGSLVVVGDHVVSKNTGVPPSHLRWIIFRNNGSSILEKLRSIKLV